MNEYKLILKYEGQNIKEGKMDAFLASERIKSFAELIQMIFHKLYDKKIIIKVTSPSKGSYTLEFYLNLAYILGNLINDPSIFNYITDIIKNLYEIIFHTKGEYPKINCTDNNDVITVKNNNGEIKNITINNHHVNINIYNDPNTYNDISKKSKLCLCNLDEDEKASIYKTNTKEENKIVEIDKEKAQYITNIKKEIEPENNKNITMTFIFK